MTTTAIRERLYDYIRVADDKKIEAIYTTLEGEMLPAYDWSADEEFVADLDERVKRFEDGLDKGFSIEEAKAELHRLRKQRLSGVVK